MKGRATTILQGYKDGGKVKAFGGKQSAAEERKEAQMVKSGKISPAEYARREASEKKEKGESHSKSQAMKTGKAIKSGKMSVGEYARGMKDGGYVCGVRSQQDYGK